MRRVAIIASASGNGKTTLGRALAERLGVRFVEVVWLDLVRLRTPDEVRRWIAS